MTCAPTCEPARVSSSPERSPAGFSRIFSGAAPRFCMLERGTCPRRFISLRRTKEKPMFRFRNWALASCILAISAFFVRAQDTDLKAVLRKAIEAHGGAKNLAKFKAVVTKFKGTIEIQGNKFDITGETSLQKPDKVKNVMTLDINGNQVEVITVFNGKKLWVNAMGKTKEIDDEKIVNAAREEMQAEGAGSFADFLEKPYELSAI